MEACILIIQIQPGKLDEAVHKFEHDSVGAMKELPGLQHNILLANPTTTTFLVTTIWETGEHKMRAETSGFVKAQIDNVAAFFAAFFAAPPSIAHYTVPVYH